MGGVCVESPRSPMSPSTVQLWEAGGAHTKRAAPTSPTTTTESTCASIKYHPLGVPISNPSISNYTLSLPPCSPRPPPQPSRALEVRSSTKSPCLRHLPLMSISCLSPAGPLVKPGVHLPNPGIPAGRGRGHHPPEELRHLLAQGPPLEIIP